MPFYSDIQSMRPRIMPDNVVYGLVQDGEKILSPKDFSGKGWDDWGTQNSTFFSQQILQEMILPYMKRIVESYHKTGMKFHLHSCGKIEKFVPYIVEIGVDFMVETRY